MRVTDPKIEEWMSGSQTERQCRSQRGRPLRPPRVETTSSGSRLAGRPRLPRPDIDATDKIQCEEHF